MQDEKDAIQAAFASMAAPQATWPGLVTSLNLNSMHDLDDMGKFVAFANLKNFVMEDIAWTCDLSALVNLTRLERFYWGFSSETYAPPSGNLDFLYGSRDSIKEISLINVGCEEEGIDLTPLLLFPSLEELDIEGSYVYRAHYDQLVEQLPDLVIEGIDSAEFLEDE